MTHKTTMPEPVAWGIFYQSVMQQGWAYNKEAAQAIADEDYPERKVEVKPLITTDQAEAYAAAKVLEALEQVQRILTGMYNESIKARVPEDEDQDGWNEGCLERALALTDASLQVRALIPKEPPCDP